MVIISILVYFLIGFIFVVLVEAMSHESCYSSLDKDPTVRCVMTLIWPVACVILLVMLMAKLYSAAIEYTSDKIRFWWYHRHEKK